MYTSQCLYPFCKYYLTFIGTFVNSIEDNNTFGRDFSVKNVSVCSCVGGWGKLKHQWGCTCRLIELYVFCEHLISISSPRKPTIAVLTHYMHGWFIIQERGGLKHPKKKKKKLHSLINWTPCIVSESVLCMDPQTTYQLPLLVSVFNQGWWWEGHMVSHLNNYYSIKYHKRVQSTTVLLSVRLQFLENPTFRVSW